MSRRSPYVLRRFSHCACGALIKNERPATCRRCGTVTKDAATPTRRFTLPIPKYIPQRIEVQHDPIKARYQWAMAVGRS